MMLKVAYFFVFTVDFFSGPYCWFKYLPHFMNNSVFFLTIFALDFINIYSIFSFPPLYLSGCRKDLGSDDLKWKSPLHRGSGRFFQSFSDCTLCEGMWQMVSSLAFLFEKSNIFYFHMVTGLSIKSGSKSYTWPHLHLCSVLCWR
jgi:hypothetical protein